MALATVMVSQWGSGVEKSYLRHTELSPLHVFDTHWGNELSSFHIYAITEPIFGFVIEAFRNGLPLKRPPDRYVLVSETVGNFGNFGRYIH